MPFLNFLDNLRAKASGDLKTTRYANTEPNTPVDENIVLAMMETLYDQMIMVMSHLPEIQQDDFDLAALKTQLLLPVAHYLMQQPKGETRPEENTPFLKPLFVSGVPGIGKTTLLMILDEVLYQLDRSCRDRVVSGQITGYFADKPNLLVTPLRLFGTSTGMLSARDWNNILRHWTFDETTADYSETALRDFISQLQGKIVIVDEAELEGYVYFSELLAQ
ncbi:MAG: ATP-binding protein, partial [Chloroflexota bacterium]